MTVDREALLRKGLRWAESYAMWLAGTQHLTNHLDDLVQAARIGAWEASRNWDPDRGVKFKTFAFRRIWGAVKDEQRSLGRHGFRVGRQVVAAGELCRRVTQLGQLDGANWQEVDHPAGLVAIIPSDDEPVGWELEYQDELKSLTRCLPAQTGAALRLLYGHAAYTLKKDAGRAMRLTESRVSQLHTQAITMLHNRHAQGGAA